MSVEQVESAILQLSSDERRQLLEWLNDNRRDLFADDAVHALTAAQQAEILKRRQEYYDHPENFISVSSEADLDRFFENIRREVQTRVSSAGKD